MCGLSTLMPDPGCALASGWSPLQSHKKHRLEGYKAHFTQTCEASASHLIVEVTPTDATTLDGEATSYFRLSI